ncbi:MAG: pyruvate carboxyltransferase [Acidobacteria bacterium]|nr:pyruvate carboxyltransferase [Acidobacteriota bacterium]
MSKPWQTDMWFTSPWNFDEEVRAAIAFDPQPRLHDVTLRDGEQQAGIVFTRDDKIRIAETLAEAGVHRLEAGMPVVSKSDELAVREIAKRLEKSKTEVFGFARCMVDDVKRSVDAGVKGIVMEVPSSTHIIERAYRWDPARAIETSVEATRFAGDHGLYVSFFPIDFSRAPLEWVLPMLKRVAAEGHMDALTIVDTFGGLAPHTVPYLVRRMRQVFPDTPFEVHFHDDFGMGVANTLMAMAAGCQVAHTSVTGIGERAGNCAYEELALAMMTMYDVNLGLKTEKFVEVSRLVQRLAGVRIPANRCVVGENLFDIESGIIVSWLRNCGTEHPTELVPFRPELVGNTPPRAVLGKGSGLDSIALFLERMGIEASQEQMTAWLAEVKARSLREKRLVTLEEFREIVSTA